MPEKTPLSRVAPVSAQPPPEGQEDASLHRTRPMASGPVCIWLTSDLPERLPDVGRALSVRLRKRAHRVTLLPDELAARRNVDTSGIPSATLKPFLARAASALLNAGLTVVVAVPRVDVMPGPELRSLCTPIVEVHVRTSGAQFAVCPDGPFTYRTVAEGRIVERQYRAPLGRPEVLIDRPPEPPVDLAGVIVDTLVRVGWLGGPPRAMVEPERTDLSAEERGRI
ncbi:MAG: hypothetical protein L3K07_00500, partial [Thermoplasmata archaeon]|nr:hypothetical protein [Thermoplasmata archaeon]